MNALTACVGLAAIKAVVWPKPLPPSESEKLSQHINTVIASGRMRQSMRQKSQADDQLVAAITEEMHRRKEARKSWVENMRKTCEHLPLVPCVPPAAATVPEAEYPLGFCVFWCFLMLFFAWVMLSEIFKPAATRPTGWDRLAPAAYP